MDKTETRTVYAYDNAGLLIGVHTLDSTDRSPISGRWQIPAGMTEIAPLPAKDGYTINWNGTAWEYQEMPKVVESEKPVETTPINTEPTLNERLSALEEIVASQQGV